MQPISSHQDSIESCHDHLISQSKTSGINGLKPWHYKPKKSKFQIEEGGRSRKKFNSSHWSPEENRKYAQFLSKFSFLINSEAIQKRKFHLNRMMSKYVQTRSPVQCRSHHQKMLQAFKSNDRIIAQFLRQGDEEYKVEEVSTTPLQRPEEPLKQEELQGDAIVAEDQMVALDHWRLEDMARQQFQKGISLWGMEQDYLNFLSFD